MNSKVDFFFENDSQWQSEYKQLRSIILETGLQEELKWGCPCYILKGKNVLLIHGFKDYCAILFHKGSLLKDTESLLIQQTKNVQAARQLRFTSLKEIQRLKSVIKAYTYEAIEVEKSGLEVEFKKTSEYNVPEELEQEFKNDTQFKIAFESLTPGRQRGYLLHFSQPKQSKTRASRIEKCKPLIYNGKGWNERK